MGNFTGTLNPNVIFAANFNMIISQLVFADNIKGTYSKLVDSARTDGSMYGDQKLYYSTDILKSYEWKNDAEAANLLKLYRPAAPKCQAIVMNIFRFIPVTVDNYLTKQAWSTEDAFSQFNSVMIGWLRETKKVYDSSTYNTFIGTTESEAEVHEITMSKSAYPTLGQGLGETLADLMVDLEDATRKFNDYGVLRSYTEDDIKIVWNAKYVNQVRKIDLPALFHNENLILKFADNVLPARYFGPKNDASKTTADVNTRSLVEIDVGGKHLFPGDAIPTGTALVSGDAISIPSYQEDGSIACKVMHRESVPYMSGFEVGTNFFNDASLTETHRLIFGHNTLEYLKDKPFITIKVED